MAFEAFIQRAPDGREVDFDRDFERKPVIQIARTLHQHFSEAPKYYALLANVDVPMGKADHTRQIDAILLSEDGLGILEFKHASAPFTPGSEDQPWKYDSSGKHVKAGRFKNPFRQVHAQRESVYLLLQDLPQYVDEEALPRPFVQHAQRSKKSRKSNKHFHHFAVSGCVVLTGKSFDIPYFKREPHQQWFEIIWMEEVAHYAKSLSFNRGVRLDASVLRTIIRDLFGMSPWIELESLYGKPFGYLRGDTLDAPLPILQASVMLGRSPDVAVRIPASNKGVSRRHALLRHIPQGAMISDAGSRNGTWVNGKRIPADEEYALQHGDRISLGHPEASAPDVKGVQFTYLTHLDTTPLQDWPVYEETVGFTAISDDMLAEAELPKLSSFSDASDTNGGDTPAHDGSSDADESGSPPDDAR